LLLDHYFLSVANIHALARWQLVELHAIEGVYAPLALWRGIGGEAFYALYLAVAEVQVEGAGGVVAARSWRRASLQS
jgi:hypothetical protein